MKQKKKRIDRKSILFVSAIILLLAGTVIVRSAIRAENQNNEPKPSASLVVSQAENGSENDPEDQQVPAIPESAMPKAGETAKNTSITISAAGDCTLGKDPSAADGSGN